MFLGGVGTPSDSAVSVMVGLKESRPAFAGGYRIIRNDYRAMSPQ